MTFIEIAKPSWYERWLVLLAQGVFYNGLFLLYLVSSRTAHRVVGYFEEEAIISYSEYLAEIESGPDREYCRATNRHRLLKTISSKPLTQCQGNA